MLQHHYDINVNFSDQHYNYYTAWRYVTKEDWPGAIESPGHPDLTNAEPPRTDAASMSHSAQSSSIDVDVDSDGDNDEGSPSKKKKKKRLSAFEVSEIETEMMTVRWCTFTFNYQIPREEQIELQPCPKCFARFILISN